MAEERKTIYLCLAHMSEEGVEQKYVKEAFDTNWVVPMGPNVNAFEQALSDFANTNSDGSKLNHKVVCLSAGTAAVHLALIACGVKPGDEVCVQSFTFCASSHPITYLGAKPVFIDSERETWNMDPELLEKAIIDRKEKTGQYPKAIIPGSYCSAELLAHRHAVSVAPRCPEHHDGRNHRLRDPGQRPVPAFPQKRPACQGGPA